MAADFAAGSVGLMNTSAGFTTALVSSTTGTVVAHARLAEAGLAAARAGAAAGGAGGPSARAVAAGAVAASPVLAVAVGAAALAGLGGFLWRRSRKARNDSKEELVQLTIECADADADAVLAEVQIILDSAAARTGASTPALRRQIPG